MSGENLKFQQPRVLSLELRDLQQTPGNLGYKSAASRNSMVVDAMAGVTQIASTAEEVRQRSDVMGEAIWRLSRKIGAESVDVEIEYEKAAHANTWGRPLESITLSVIAKLHSPRYSLPQVYPMSISLMLGNFASNDGLQIRTSAELAGMVGRVEEGIKAGIKGSEQLPE